MFKMIADMVGFNHSMFSGAMDVIVIEDANQTLKSSSFHVRFGSWKILQSKEKVVDIYINGKWTDVNMLLSGSGDAYFLKNDNKKQCEEIVDINKPFNDNPEIIPINQGHSSDWEIDNFTNKPPQQNQSAPAWLISDCLKEICSLDKFANNDIKAKTVFINNWIPKSKFFEDPNAILEGNNTAFYYNNRIYNYKAISPIVFSGCLYKDTLPVNKQIEVVLKGGLAYTFTDKDVIRSLSGINMESIKVSNSNDSTKTKNKRTFFPTSEQLKKLNWNYGENEITFEVQSSIAGTKQISAHIFLWASTAKIIISDIDGTITKSDVLGQIMPIIGKDWSHKGITDWYTNISNNGYKFLYLTARAICQSQSTKDYLNTLFQEKKSLPPGPWLMSPDGWFSSFKREVIDRSPQLLKINTWTEIRTLFPKAHSPFFAGFGNRETDAVAYRAVGIQWSRIFIINPQGDVVQLDNSIRKNYTLWNEIVHDLFVSTKKKERENEENLNE